METLTEDPDYDKDSSDGSMMGDGDNNGSDDESDEEEGTNGQEMPFERNYYPFPSKLFALLFMLVNIPQPMVILYYTNDLNYIDHCRVNKI